MNINRILSIDRQINKADRQINKADKPNDRDIFTILR